MTTQETIQDRIKHLRKNLLNMTQEEFAKEIHISRSNFANIEKGSVNLTDRVIADICRAFSVNRQWLIDGQEPVYTQENDQFLNDLISSYKKLSEENQKYLQKHAYWLLEEQSREDDKK